MSAAKLAAEARRAKILARASKTTISAVTGDDDEGPILNLDAAVAGAVKERPLAARQATIQAAALKVEETERSLSTTPVKDSGNEEVIKSPAAAAPSSSGANSSSSKKNHDDDPEVESIDDMIAKFTAEVNAEKATPQPKKKYVYEKKSLAEIEAEVAQNTAKFDKKVLGGKDGEEAASSSSSTATAATSSAGVDTAVDASVASEEKKKVASAGVEKDSEKTDEKSSEKGEKKENGGKAATKEQVAAVTKKTAPSSPPKASINPQSVVNILRISLIMIFASYSGYRCVSESVALSLAQPSSSSDSAVAAFENSATTVIYDEFGAVVGEEITVGDNQDAAGPSFMPPLQQQKERPARTWAGWFRSYLECSLSAMMLAHWLSGVATPSIYRKLGRVENKTSFFSFATVMSIWTNGMESIYETVYSTIGDIALHNMMLVLSTTLFTLLMSNTGTGGAFSSSTDSAALNAGTLDEL